MGTSEEHEAVWAGTSDGTGEGERDVGTAERTGEDSQLWILL